MIQKIKNIYHLLNALYWCIYYGFPSNKLTVIGVTGTDGKTTTTTLIYEALKSCGVKVSMISTVQAEIAGKTYDTGFHVTSPDPKDIQKFLRKAVNAGHTHFVLETTSHALDQNRIFGVHYSIGVLTNITHEHLDYHKTFDDYKMVKFSLLKRSQIAIVPEEYITSFKKLIRQTGPKRVISYGLSKNAECNPQTYNIKPFLPGTYNLKNCLAALSVIKALGMNMNSATRTIASFKGIPGRMEILQNLPYRIIVDFAHTPNALHEVLSTVKKTTKKRLIHVFGSAAFRDITKRPLMGKESDMYADIIILTEEDSRTENVVTIMDHIQMGIQNNKKVTRYAIRSEAISYACSIAQIGDTVIVTGKGHEQSLCRGTVEYPWNDSSFIKQYLHLS